MSGTTKPIKCPQCGYSALPEKFAIDMFRNIKDEIKTLNQCEKCQQIFTT